MIKDSIAILCRGESLKEIELLPEVEEYVIVNGFSDEFEIEYIKNILFDKKITHVLSLGTLNHAHPSGSPNGCFGAMLEKNNFKEFNIEKIVLSYVAECLPHDADNKVIHTVKNKKGDVIPVYCLSDNHKKYMIKNHPRYKFTYPSCGMGSVALSAVDLNKKNIYIIGMDFYENSGYLKRGVYESQEAAIKRSSTEGQQLKKFLPNFISQHPSINFNIYTYANLDSTLENFKINILKK
jgi:hypothetical protein